MCLNKEVSKIQEVNGRGNNGSWSIVKENI